VRRRLIFSQDAIRGIADISAYLTREFSEEFANLYYKNLSKVLSNLEVLPATSPLADRNRDVSLRRKVSKRLTVILYRFDDDFVYIENVVDARSDWKERD